MSDARKRDAWMAVYGPDEAAAAAIAAAADRLDKWIGRVPVNWRSPESTADDAVFVLASCGFTAEEIVALIGSNEFLVVAYADVREAAMNVATVFLAFGIKPLDVIALGQDL